VTELDDHFAVEMFKVQSGLQQNGIAVSEAKARSMLLAIMNKAREMGDGKVKVADTVVNMFVRENANRARENFQNRRPKVNPVQVRHPCANSGSTLL
jgi:hypothetical protein